MESFRYLCHSCGESHEGMPSFVFDAPAEYLAIPEEEREERAVLGTDNCIIDDHWFFIRVQLEVPVGGYDEPFIFGVWVSISEASYEIFTRTFRSLDRQKEEPFFAWLTSVPFPFPEDLLKARVHLRPFPTRPFLELEPTKHPLSKAQRDGISVGMAQTLVTRLLHGTASGYLGEVVHSAPLGEYRTGITPREAWTQPLQRGISLRLLKPNGDSVSVHLDDIAQELPAPHQGREALFLDGEILDGVPVGTTVWIG